MIVYKPNFLTKDECKALNDWADLGVKNKWLDKGLNLVSSSGWEYAKRLTTRNYGDRFDYPDIVRSIQDKISKHLAIEDLEKSVVGGGRDGVVVSCTFPGGDVYQHVDPKEGELEVLRCNILTRKADIGGELYIGGSKIDVAIGDLHCYLPSTVEHFVTEVQGTTSRVLWMFGYQCSIERFNQIWQTRTQT